MVKQGIFTAIIVGIALGVSLPTAAIAERGHRPGHHKQYREHHGHRSRQHRRHLRHHPHRHAHHKHHLGHRAHRHAHQGFYQYPTRHHGHGKRYYPNFQVKLFFGSHTGHYAPYGYQPYGPTHHQMHYVLETVPSGTRVPWRHPDSGYAGVITPTRTYQDASGQYCREYQQTIIVDGEQRQAYGTACRQPDGSWMTRN